jgi:hypothetical protein
MALPNSKDDRRASTTCDFVLRFLKVWKPRCMAGHLHFSSRHGQPHFQLTPCNLPHQKLHAFCYSRYFLHPSRAMPKGAAVAMTVPSQYRTRIDRSSSICDACPTIPAHQQRNDLQHGLGFKASSLEFYLPNFKSTESGGIWTTWVGLSTPQADELCIWENIFRDCLLKCIVPLQYQAHGGPEDIFLSRTVHLPSLVMEMVDLYGAYGYDRAITATAAPYDWFTSAISVYQRVDQFVRLHDCFVPAESAPFSSDTVAIEFRASHDNSIEIKWHPGCYLSFDDLEIMAVPGQCYFLKPRCHTKYACITNISFSTSCGWLEWDERSAAFLGFVPTHWSTPQPQRSRSLTITITAAITQQVDETVSFKQNIRTSVTIPVQTAAAGTVLQQPPGQSTRPNGQKFKTIHCVKDRYRTVKRRKRLPSLPLKPDVPVSAPKYGHAQSSPVICYNCNSFGLLCNCE